MTNIGLALVIGIFVVVGAWYMRANGKWIRLLAVDDPKLAYDPARDPIGWATGGPYRVRTWLAHLRRHDERPAVEYWRIRTINRFEVWIGLSMLAFLGGDWVVRHIASFAQAMVGRFGSDFGTVGIVAFGGMLSIYSVYLGRSVVEYGNGRRPAALELAFGVVGTTITLIGMAIMPNLDLSKA